MKRVAVLGMLVMAFCSTAYGQADSVEQRISALEARVQTLEKKIGEQDQCIRKQTSVIDAQKDKIQGYEARLQEFDDTLHRQSPGAALLADGFKIGAGATMIVQGTGNTNATAVKKGSRADASYSADVTLEKEFCDVGGKAFIQLTAGKGDGLTNDLSLYSGVNGDADNDENLRLSEVWYAQKFAGDAAVLSFGKMDPSDYFDNNEAANDETTQFLADMFVNNPAIEFPDKTAGVRMAVAPVEWMELGAGVFDADADFEDINGDPFVIGQIGFKPKFFGREGNYRVLAWKSGAEHTDWRDASRTGKSAYGYALSFDQELTGNVTAFARYGWQDPNVYNPELTATGSLAYSLEQSWSTGLQCLGAPWGREKDIVGLAVGQAIPSGEYKKADPSRRAKNEGHLEAYYLIHVNDHLSISPDFQYIWNPFGKDIADDTSNVAVYGVRTQIDF